MFYMAVFCVFIGCLFRHSEGAFPEETSAKRMKQIACNPISELRPRTRSVNLVKVRVADSCLYKKCPGVKTGAVFIVLSSASL